MTILEQYEEAVKSVTDLKDEFNKEIVRKDLPLDWRWKLFLSAPLLHDSSPWVVDFKSLGRVSWYDDFGTERYQTVNISDIVDVLIENEEPKEKIEAFMEEVLKRNLGSFTCDW